MNFQTFNDAVLQWAASKNITNPETQLLKFFEEKGEFARALLDKDEKSIQDELGDLFVVGCIYFWQRKTEPFLDDTIALFIQQKLVGRKLINLDKMLIEANSWYFEDLLSINSSFGFNLSETLERVLTKISEREGQTIDGCFFKK